MPQVFRCILLTAIAALCHAQGWEAGGQGGYGFAPSISVSNAGRSAAAGFSHGLAASAFLGQELYKNVEGEISYTFRWAPVRLSSGSAHASFAGHTHAAQYDVLIYTKPREAPLRPFVAIGGGVRVFRGTDWEPAYQPLQEFALLTKTTQIKPVFSLGVGIRKNYGRFFFRAEVRDYMSPFPAEVIAPARNSQYHGGWVHDIGPLVGFGRAF